MAVEDLVVLLDSIRTQVAKPDLVSIDFRTGQRFQHVLQRGALLLDLGVEVTTAVTVVNILELGIVSLHAASRKRMAASFLISVLNRLRARDTAPVAPGSLMRRECCAFAFIKCIGRKSVENSTVATAAAATPCGRRHRF